MTEERRKGVPLDGPVFYGMPDQVRAIQRWENTGWAFLHWTEVPCMLAIMENAIGDVVFLDVNGFAWKGPHFTRADPVPLEQYPPAQPYEWV